MAPAVPDNPPYPLYNTTFTLHRLSPLHHPLPLTPSHLHTHASHLHDLLAGDILRGVRVGLSEPDSALARVGSLRSVRWTHLASEDAWGGGESPDTALEEARGMLIEIIYERANYLAILLRDNGARGEQEEEGFAHYPLLLTRMPATLRTTLLDFLVSTFDTRASALVLPSSVLTAALEKFLADVGSDTAGDVVVGFSFADAAAEGGQLRGMDVTIARDDVGGMVARGEGSFMASLARYLDAHLGMDTRREEVRIVKVACKAWVLGEGKMKLFQGVTRGGLVEGLVAWAGGREVG